MEKQISNEGMSRGSIERVTKLAGRLASMRFRADLSIRGEIMNRWLS